LIKNFFHPGDMPGDDETEKNAPVLVIPVWCRLENITISVINELRIWFGLVHLFVMKNPG
jgi:hypothetical protein